MYPPCPGSTADGPGPLGGGGGGPRRCGRPPPGPRRPLHLYGAPCLAEHAQPANQSAMRSAIQPDSKPGSQPLRHLPSRTASQPPSPVRQQLDSQLAGHVARQPVSLCNLVSRSCAVWRRRVASKLTIQDEKLGLTKKTAIFRYEFSGSQSCVLPARNYY